MTKVTSAARRASCKAAKRASIRVMAEAALARAALSGNTRKLGRGIARRGFAPQGETDQQDAAEADREAQQPKRHQSPEIAAAAGEHEAERTGAGKQQDHAENEAESAQR